MRILKTILIILFFALKLSAQTDSSASGKIEIMIIDSYISPDEPHKFVLSFFTSERCRSKIILDDKSSYDVSKNLTEDHKIELGAEKLKLQRGILYHIVATDSAGNETKSELYEVKLPDGFVIPDEKDPGIFSICLGAVIFAIPAPAYLLEGSGHRWSLSKEIPLINFYSNGYNYPAGYIGLEYSYIFNAERKNYLRLGYKQMVLVEGIKYIAPGIGTFTDFKGYNGLSAEISAGLFQIQNVFTFYLRYRYNFQTVSDGKNFHEFSIGLYSNFFSLNL